MYVSGDSRLESLLTRRELDVDDLHVGVGHRQANRRKFPFGELRRRVRDGEELALERSDGTSFVDMTDPSKPVRTASLVTPAMQSPHESLTLHQGRGLLLADMGYPITRYSGAAFKVDVKEGDGSVRGFGAGELDHGRNFPRLRGDGRWHGALRGGRRRLRRHLGGAWPGHRDPGRRRKGRTGGCRRCQRRCEDDQNQELAIHVARHYNAPRQLRPVTSWKGRVAISLPASATPMMMLVPQPRWQASSAVRITSVLPVQSNV